MMRISTKFSVAVHTLLLIAVTKEPCSSTWIAGSVNTNPVVIRRIVGQLQKAGLLSGMKGRCGYRLMQPSRHLTLLDIYRAVAMSEADQLFAIHDHPNIHCPVGSSIHGLLGSVMGGAQTAMEMVLAEITLQHLIDKIQEGPGPTLATTSSQPKDLYEEDRPHPQKIVPII